MDGKGIDSIEKLQLTAYLSQIGSDFCPFLSPSMKQQKLSWSSYSIESTDPNEVEASIGLIGFLCTERFRFARAAEKHRVGRLLICHNVALNLQPSFSPTTLKEFFAWPHWILKSLYTEAGVMFGKFWIGERETSVNGEQIPIPPCNFLSIRSAVLPTDQRFFDLSPALLEELHSSCDNMEELLGAVSLKPTSRKVLTRARHRMAHQGCPRSDVYTITSLAKELKEQGIYRELKNWASTKI